MKKKKLFILDVYPILYRAHFAMLKQHLYTTSGLNTSAILGFCNYIFQIIFKEKPTYIAAAFDSYSVQRTALHLGYKSTREPMPEDIVVAKDYIIDFVQALNIKIFQRKGYEADDVIGTVAKNMAKEGDTDVYIVSPDKDFAQLVDDNIFLYRPSYQGINFDILNEEKVKTKYGVPPNQIADLLALKGDPIDNIPGVPKIGEKTAVDLLTRFHNVEEVIERREEITKVSIRKSLLENEELARKSKQLAMINTNLPLNFKKEDLYIKSPNIEKLVGILDQLEFLRLKERIFSNSFYKKFFKEIPVEENRKSKMLGFKVITIDDNEDLGWLLIKTKKEKKFTFLSTIDDDNLNIIFQLSDDFFIFNSKINLLPEVIFEILESEDIFKITYQVKPISKMMITQGRSVKNVFDVLLMHYIITPDATHKLDKIIAQELGISINPNWSGEENQCAELKQLNSLKEKWDLNPAHQIQTNLYSTIDFPLVNSIGKMEINGIKIDKAALAEETKLLQKEIDQIEQRIYEIAGEKLNLRSSKQLAGLFSRILKDVPVRKTKSGQLSTSEATLMEYAEGNEIAEQLLRFRKLTKLVSTYTESLPKFINSHTGRIHAQFLQTNTATGRLSCNNPNLQNIPIRGEEGREVRRAVVSENDDYLILSADYSQIELRLLAGLSKDEGLADAFLNHEDVHTTTAAKVFNVDESEVSYEMRKKAKMVNYGIAYGISPYGLAQGLRIHQAEGKEIIDQYFNKFPGIKKFVDETIQFTRGNGYSETLTGRRRYIEAINSQNRTERRAAERIAINSPIQGLAADLIKISMIDIDREFQKRNFKSKMIMQIHDELVFEVYRPELKVVAKIVKEKMEKAINVGVPIEVNIGVGKNWLDLDEYSNF